MSDQPENTNLADAAHQHAHDEDPYVPPPPAQAHRTNTTSPMNSTATPVPLIPWGNSISSSASSNSNRFVDIDLEDGTRNSANRADGTRARVTRCWKDPPFYFIAVAFVVIGAAIVGFILYTVVQYGQKADGTQPKI